MLPVIATKKYIQTVKEKSPVNSSSSDSDDDSYPPRSSKKSIISREVSVQEKKFIDTLPKCLRVIKASAMSMHRMLKQIEQNVYVHAW